MRGFAGARARGLDAEDCALPGRRGPTRVASGASSESVSDEELSEESEFEGRLLEGPIKVTLEDTQVD